MDGIATRIDELEVASFLDRIALFSAEGCKPHQALGYAWASIDDETVLHREIEAVINAAKDGQSSATVLREVGERTGNEGLILASMACVTHLVAGVELSHPLNSLAEALRRQHALTMEKATGLERELAVALFADKWAYLAEIDKSPRDAMATLAGHDPVLGAELSQIHGDLQMGRSLSESLARSARRTGSRGIKLMAEAIEVSTLRGFPMDAVLRQVADVIRRNPGT